MRKNKIETHIETLYVKIAKLKLSPGDVLVLMVDGYIPPDRVKWIKEQFDPIIPAGVKAVVLSGGMRLSVLTSAEIENSTAA